MVDYLEKIPAIVDVIESVRNTIITNVVLIGEKSAPTFREKERADMFMERLAEFQVDECTWDSYKNPIGIIRGTVPEKSPIFMVAHLDTFIDKDSYFNYTIKKNSITGPGVADNSTGVGVLISLPMILKKLNLRFQSDLVLAGVIQSVGKGNLRGIRNLVKTWPGSIRGAVCVEGVELGRLNYYSGGMIRAEIDCSSAATVDRPREFKPNAILVLNEIINKILELRLPQRPRSKIVVGRFSGGINHGKDASSANIGFEIRSDADDIVKDVYSDIEDIVDCVQRIYEVELKLKTISNLSATQLRFNHPLVKSTNEVMKRLELEPISESSESELSIFLANGIPAVTLGITHSDKQDQEAAVEIKPMFKGIAQIVGVLMAIDQGVCDGQKLA
ncbi:MAG: hypothetical protein GY866_14805 [Proteobacteria bacterium]|nr:hypothetical protein [Pseudomonadota bacterium]